MHMGTMQVHPHVHWLIYLLYFSLSFNNLTVKTGTSLPQLERQSRNGKIDGNFFDGLGGVGPEGCSAG